MIHASSILLALLVASSASAAPLLARPVNETPNNTFHSALIAGLGHGPHIPIFIPNPSTGNILTSLRTSTGVDPGSVATSEPTSTSAFFPLGSPTSLPPPKEIVHRDYELNTLTELSARADAEGAARRDLLEARHHPARDLEARTPKIPIFEGPGPVLSPSLLPLSLFEPSATVTAIASTTDDGTSSALPTYVPLEDPLVLAPTPSPSGQAGSSPLSQALASARVLEGRDVLEVLHHYIRDPKNLLGTPFSPQGIPHLGPFPATIDAFPTSSIASPTATSSEKTGFGIRPQATTNSIPPNLPVDDLPINDIPILDD